MPFSINNIASQRVNTMQLVSTSILSSLTTATVSWLGYLSPLWLYYMWLLCNEHLFCADLTSVVRVRVRRSSQTSTHCCTSFSLFHLKMKFLISFDRLPRSSCSSFVPSRAFQHKVWTVMMTLSSALQWWANLKSNPTLKSQIQQEIDLNQLSKSEIPNPHFSSDLKSFIGKSQIKSVIDMQYLSCIVNLKFTPATFCAVCTNTQTVSKVCVCSLSIIQSLAVHIGIGLVLHSKKKGFNCHLLRFNFI